MGLFTREYPMIRRKHSGMFYLLHRGNNVRLPFGDVIVNKWQATIDISITVSL